MRVYQIDKKREKEKGPGHLYTRKKTPTPQIEKNSQGPGQGQNRDLGSFMDSFLKITQGQNERILRIDFVKLHKDNELLALQTGPPRDHNGTTTGLPAGAHMHRTTGGTTGKGLPQWHMHRTTTGLPRDYHGTTGKCSGTCTALRQDYHWTQLQGPTTLLHTGLLTATWA